MCVFMDLPMYINSSSWLVQWYFMEFTRYSNNSSNTLKALLFCTCVCVCACVHDVSECGCVCVHVCMCGLLCVSTCTKWLVLKVTSIKVQMLVYIMNHNSGS